MKVYPVLYEEGVGDGIIQGHVVKVFASEELAQEWVSKRGQPAFYSISEFDLIESSK